MKKAGMKKGKNKEFSTPYTVTNAVAKGNIITKLSLLIMGLGNIAHKQIGKGIMFLAVEAAYIWYMIQSGIYNLSMLPSLGWREQEKVWNEKKSIYERLEYAEKVKETLQKELEEIKENKVQNQWTLTNKK